MIYFISLLCLYIGYRIGLEGYKINMYEKKLKRGANEYHNSDTQQPFGDNRKKKKNDYKNVRKSLRNNEKNKRTSR